jgi:geranylgeranyl pyrophosphate synthase
LRRGKPSAHTIFGPAQAINSSSYGIAKAISQIQSFSDPLCVKFAIGKKWKRLLEIIISVILSDPRSTEQIMTMFQGQAMDLYWTYNAICPSIEEYTQMVGNSKHVPIYSIRQGCKTD